MLSKYPVPVFVLILLCNVWLASCSTAPAPVDSLSPPPSQKINTHVVGKGETLFSIAWAYGLDYRALARSNNLDSSYTIYPGQVLKLDTDAAPASTKTSSSKMPLKPLAAAPTKTPAMTTAPVAKNPVSKPATSSTTGGGRVAWQWPAVGKVIQPFSESGTVNKGIDIAGNLGEAVKAAAGGRVVYSGSGLLGYGQLIIIKHNDEFLSAYAHNRVLLVKEGDSVKAGDKIAEIGASGAEKVKLHFEIRRSGKPVDPEDYLPRR